MDRRDAYHGQVVTEGDVDEWFDDVEDAEEQLAKDAGVRQATLAETPSSSIFGGILAGLAVTGVDGYDYVTVALGSARDDDGEHIKLVGAATVKLSHAGLTVTGEDTDAVGAGAAIAGGVCAAGQRVVLSLFACVARDLQDQKTDASGATIDYDQLESFCFYLATGSADYDHANVMAGTETPTRAALANNYVLLADIIAENSAGTMVFRAVMNTTPQWINTYSPPGNYASLTGRRADWLALQTTDEFTTAEGAEDIVRVGTAREALYDLGRRVRSEAFTAHRQYGSPVLFSMRKRFGHPARPREFYDHMMHLECDHANGKIGDAWSMEALGGGALGGGSNEVVFQLFGALGVVGAGIMQANNVLNEGVAIRTPLAFDIGAVPYALGLFRFNVPVLAGIDFTFGFRTTFANFNTSACFVLGGAGVMTGRIVDSGGGVGTQPTVGTIVAGTWNTGRLLVESSTRAHFWLNNGARQTSFAAGAGTLASGSHFFGATVIDTVGGGAVKQVWVSQAYASEAQLSSDMA